MISGERGCKCCEVIFDCEESFYTVYSDTRLGTGLVRRGVSDAIGRGVSDIVEGLVTS